VGIITETDLLRRIVITEETRIPEGEAAD